MVVRSRRAAPPSRPQSFGGGFGGGSAFDQAISYHSANVNTSNSRGATVDFEKESSRDVFARNDFVKSYSSSCNFWDLPMICSPKYNEGPVLGTFCKNRNLSQKDKD